LIQLLKKNSPEDKLFLKKLKKHLNIKPNNIEIYRTAFIHKSAAYNNRKYLETNNERLEFLGDSILDSIVTDYIYHKYKNEDEGFLTKVRSKIVKRKSLDYIASKLNLNKIIIFKSFNKNHKHIYGNALEAFIGAVYLDKGYKFANKYVIKNIIEKIINIDDIEAEESDYKSKLIEFGQKNRNVVLFESYEKYNDLKKNPVFGASAKLDGEVLGEGEGRNKKEAEQNAAKKALTQLNII
jgi:ribonuclease-3